MLRSESWEMGVVSVKTSIFVIFRYISTKPGDKGCVFYYWTVLQKFNAKFARTAEMSTNVAWRGSTVTFCAHPVDEAWMIAGSESLSTSLSRLVSAVEVDRQRASTRRRVGYISRYTLHTGVSRRWSTLQWRVRQTNQLSTGAGSTDTRQRHSAGGDAPWNYRFRGWLQVTSSHGMRPWSTLAVRIRAASIAWLTNCWTTDLTSDIQRIQARHVCVQDTARPGTAVSIRWMPAGAWHYSLTLVVHLVLDNRSC